MKDHPIINFAHGIPGFEEYIQFRFIEIEGDIPMKLMQSVEESNISFLIASPFFFYSEYEFDLSESAEQELEIVTESDVEVWSIVTVPADPSQATINLQAPLVINRNKQVGKQIILHDSEYNSRTPLVSTRR